MFFFQFSHFDMFHRSVCYFILMSHDVLPKTVEHGTSLASSIVLDSTATVSNSWSLTTKDYIELAICAFRSLRCSSRKLYFAFPLYFNRACKRKARFISEIFF